MTAMYIAVTALCALLRWARTCLVQVAFIQRPKTGQERVVGAVERELSELKCRLLKLEGEKADTEKAAAEKVGHLEEAMKEGFAAVRGEVAAVKGELAAWKRELAYGYFADRKVHELQQQGHALIMQAGEWMPSCCGPPQKQKQSGASTMQAEGWRSTIFGATQRQSGPFSVRAEQCRSSVFGSPRKQKQRGAPTEQAEECRLS
ncbi:unnamed protein product [Closterium sp. Naga37s-1]|nr:unnamed protein product [Closterium sp. Naga37s-1]